MYYITITAKRKNAKRHIAKKVNTIEDAKKSPFYNYAKEKDCKYNYEIYTGKWDFVNNLKSV